MRIIFFGADRWFSGPVLAAILKAGHQVPVIVTKGDALGEGRRKIRFIQANNSNDISLDSLAHAFNLRPSLPAAATPQALQAGAFGLSKPDAIVLASFGPPFLVAEVLDWPRYGCLNVHASLLPRWRGASPVFAAIAAGDRETGVSIMRMTEEIDRGAVLGQRKIMIAQPGLPKGAKGSDLGSGERSDPFDTRETLTKKLGILGGKLIVETLIKLSNDQIIEVKQPKKSPTPYTRRLTKDSGRIDWSQSPIETERFIRAVTPWPGAWTEYRAKGQRLRAKGQTIKILKTHLSLSPSFSPWPSALGPYLTIDEVQLPGKNPISWNQFLAGHPGVNLE